MAVRVDPRVTPSLDVLAREQRLALLQLSRPRAAVPTPPPPGSRCVLGPARADRAAATARPPRSGSPATRAARRCAAPRGSRRAPPRPRRRRPPCCSAHGCAVLDVRVGRRGSGPRPRRTPLAKSSRVIAAGIPSNAVAAASRERPVVARRRARHRRSSSPPCSARGSRGCRSCSRDRRCSAAPSPRTRSRRRGRSAGRP